MPCRDRCRAGRVGGRSDARRSRGIAVSSGHAAHGLLHRTHDRQSALGDESILRRIEETAALVDAAGGRGIRFGWDHGSAAGPGARRAHSSASRPGALLVNDIFGATKIEWNKSVWESDLDYGLHLLRLAIDTHAITSHFAIPLLLKEQGGLVVEVNDGTAEYNDTTYRNSFFYDLAKSGVQRMGFSLAHELAPHGATALSLTPGWLRSEAMLDAFQVTEANWRDATEFQPHFAISETPAFVGRAVAALAQDPNVARWNGKSLSSGQLAKIYGYTDLDGSQPDAWRYLVEVQDRGKPADVTGYR